MEILRVHNTSLVQVKLHLCPTTDRAAYMEILRVHTINNTCTSLVQVRLHPCPTTDRAGC